MNLLVVDLDVEISAHALCKMLIFYEPKNVALRNIQHFVDSRKKNWNFAERLKKLSK